jgi:hypothetical protein
MWQIAREGTLKLQTGVRSVVTREVAVKDDFDVPQTKPLGVGKLAAELIA